MTSVTIVVDNFCQRQGLYAEWGFSAFIRTPSGNLLWDTGGILHVLLHNLRALGIRPEGVENLALSHGHFDHASGLTDILRVAPSAKLWASREIARLRWGDADASRASGGGPLFAGLPFTPVDGGVEILPEVIAFTVPADERDPRFLVFDNMFETGATGDKVPDTFADDVSLLVKGSAGWSVVLGCAHAGLPNILNYAMKRFGIEGFDAVTGGTHLSGACSEELPVWMDALAAVPGFLVFDNMFETGATGDKVPDTFADDVSLLVKGSAGWSVVLGCAHAGLPNILNYAMKRFGIEGFDAVTGGTHLSGACSEELPVWMDALAAVPVRRWRVNHCTGFRTAAALAGRFDDVDWAGAGAVLTF